MRKKITNFYHKEMTDEESYENAKKLHKENPDVFMSALEWKKERLKELKKEGKRWSR